VKWVLLIVLLLGFGWGGVIVSLEFESWFFASTFEMVLSALIFSLLGLSLWLNKSEVNLVPYFLYSLLNLASFSYILLFHRTFDPRRLSTASALSFELLYWVLVILIFAVSPKIKKCYN